MKVLIADDDTITRVALGKLLEKWGYDIVQARDGGKAWELLCQKDPPNVFFTPIFQRQAVYKWFCD